MDNSYPALRVVQLDAEEYDLNLTEILASQSEQCVKPLCLDASKFAAEIKVIVKTVIWWHSMRVHGATVGQEMMGLRYVNAQYRCRHMLEEAVVILKKITTTIDLPFLEESDQAEFPTCFLKFFLNRLHIQTMRNISSTQKVFHFVCWILLPWLRERSDAILRRFCSEKTADAVARQTPKIDAICDLLWLANFLLFLNRGDFSTIVDRLTNAKLVHNAPVTMESQTPDLLAFNREVLWHGFAEMLTFAAPFVSVAYFRRLYLRLVCRWKRAIMSPEQRAKKAVVCMDTQSKCVICDSFPILPQTLGCEHLYCFHCAYSNTPFFDCTICGKTSENNGPTPLGSLTA